MITIIKIRSMVSNKNNVVNVCSCYNITSANLIYFICICSVYTIAFFFYKIRNIISEFIFFICISRVSIFIPFIKPSNYIVKIRIFYLTITHPLFQSYFIYYLYIHKYPNLIQLEIIYAINNSLEVRYCQLLLFFYLYYTIIFMFGIYCFIILLYSSFEISWNILSTFSKFICLR